MHSAYLILSKSKLRKGFRYFNWYLEKGVLFENKEDFSLKWCILIFSTENWFCGSFTVLYPKCHCTLYAIVHLMPLYTQCHCTLNAIVHLMPLYTQCHCTLNAIVHLMPLYTQCHCTLNAIVHLMPLYTQCHCTLNAIVHSMALHTQCIVHLMHCTLNAIAHSMPLYTRTQFSTEKYGTSPSLMIRRTFKRVPLYIKYPLL